MLYIANSENSTACFNVPLFDGPALLAVIPSAWLIVLFYIL